MGTNELSDWLGGDSTFSENLDGTYGPRSRKRMPRAQWRLLAAAKPTFQFLSVRGAYLYILNFIIEDAHY